MNAVTRFNDIKILESTKSSLESQLSYLFNILGLEVDLNTNILDFIENKIINDIKKERDDVD